MFVANLEDGLKIIHNLLLQLFLIGIIKIGEHHITWWNSIMRYFKLNISLFTCKNGIILVLVKLYSVHLGRCVSIITAIEILFAFDRFSIFFPSAWICNLNNNYPNPPHLSMLGKMTATLQIIPLFSWHCKSTRLLSYTQIFLHFLTWFLQNLKSISKHYRKLLCCLPPISKWHGPLFLDV